MSQNQLRAIRRSRGLTQQAVSVQAHVAGSILVAIERYGYVPTRPTCERIATVLGCDVSDVWPESKSHADRPVFSR